MSKYTTGEIAKLCGVSVRTVQYYDSRSILVPSELSEGGRRLYSEDDLKQMRIICFLREAGLPINSISALFAEEHPEKIISLLLDRQEQTLRETIAEEQKKLDIIESIKRELKEMDNFSVASINDIAYVMENKKELRKMRWLLVLTGIPVTTLQWVSIVLWITNGLWWLFAVWACVSGCEGFTFSIMLLSFPRRQKALHQIVLRVCSAVLGGAVLLDDLVYLIPQAVCLVHVVDADVNEGRRDRLARCRVLGEIAERTGHLLTLNPSGGAHGVPLQKLRRHYGSTAYGFQPVPGFLVDFLCLKLTAVTLGGGEKIMGLWHIYTAHIWDVENLERSAARIAAFHLVGKGFLFASCARSGAALSAQII